MRFYMLIIFRWFVKSMLDSRKASVFFLGGYFYDLSKTECCNFFFFRQV